MELLRYLLTNIVKRPMRDGLHRRGWRLERRRAGLRLLSGPARDRAHPRRHHRQVDGPSLGSAARDFEFKDERTADYEREAAAVRAYLAADSGASTQCPGWMSYCEMQGGAKR